MKGRQRVNTTPQRETFFVPMMMMMRGKEEGVIDQPPNWRRHTQRGVMGRETEELCSNPANGLRFIGFVYQSERRGKRKQSQPFQSHFLNQVRALCVCRLGESLRSRTEKNTPRGGGGIASYSIYYSTHLLYLCENVCGRVTLAP